MNQTEFIISAYMYSVFMCLCRRVLEAGVCWLEYCCDIYYSTISSHILAAKDIISPRKTLGKLRNTARSLVKKVHQKEKNLDGTRWIRINY